MYEASDVFSEVAAQGSVIYDEQLKVLLEPEYKGKAVAINVENAEYGVAASLKDARALLHATKRPGIVSMSRIIGDAPDYALLA